MSQLKLLILDAGVVIYLHQFGVWDKFLSLCQVLLPATVVDEAEFYEIGDEKRYTNLTTEIGQGRIEVFNVPIPEIKSFKARFDPNYLGELDPGESEALAYLFSSKVEYLISSTDIIVYKVLGRLNRGEQGISLEEILTKIGLQQRDLDSQCSKSFREKHTKAGETDAIQGIGLIK